MGPGIWHGFHKFVLRRDFEIENDWWSVEHLHGLGFNTVRKVGKPENDVRTLFVNWIKAYVWRKQYNVVEFRAPQDCSKEKSLLKNWKVAKELAQLNIRCEIQAEWLGMWEERDQFHSHHYARYLKDTYSPCFGLSGCMAHTDFTNACGNEYKVAHGYHCALYDVVEAALKIEENSGNMNFIP